MVLLEHGADVLTGTAIKYSLESLQSEMQHINNLEFDEDLGLFLEDTDIFDEYVDQFTLGGGPYWIVLNLKKSSPKPVAPGSTPQAEDIGAVRMSLEHFKMMAFIMKRQVDDIESQLGIDIPLPVQLMNAQKIAPEDWQMFWKRS